MKEIHKHFNLQRGRWWNYYERGVCLLTWEHYKEALADLEKAIEKREEDRRNARTYGMHFIDYFPNREKGVAYCLWAEQEKLDTVKREDRFEKAMDALEASIDQEPSSKAMFYLKRATAGYWSVTKEDRKPPAVWVKNDEIDRWKNVPTLYVNGFTAELEIWASDDKSGVGEVWVDRERLFVESAEKDFKGSKIVMIDPNRGERTVKVQAFDLAGHASPLAKVRLIADTVPPIASIRVKSEGPALMDGRLPLEVIAVDDKGLKSVQMGEDSSGSRNCRGQSTWEGTFYPETGAGDLAFEVADLAGNITAMNVNVERAQKGETRLGELLLAMNAPLGRNQNLWKNTSESTPRGPTRTLNLWTHLSSLPSYASLQGPASNRDRSLTPEFVFQEFAYVSGPLSTSEDEFLLQGEITNTQGLRCKEIKIDSKVDSIKIKQDAILDRGDNRFFSAWVPLSDSNEPQSIKVEAIFEDVASKQEICLREPNLPVRKVPNPLWADKSLYSVILLPLEDENLKKNKNVKNDTLESDVLMSTAHSQANRRVLDAVDLYKVVTDGGEPRHRFNCEKLLDKWSPVLFYEKLWSCYPEEERERKKTRTTSDKELAQRASVLAAAYPTDLGIYGLFRQEGNNFEIKIGFTRANSDGEQLLPATWIDIYGSETDPNYYVKGLASKMKIWMPRLRGHVADANASGDRIEVELAEEKNVFTNMDLRLYDNKGTQKNPNFEKKCDVTATQGGIFKRFAARIANCGTDFSLAAIGKQRREYLLVMSK